MSGGTFNYMQYRINDIVEEIKDNFDRGYSEKVEEKFREGIKALKIAQIYAQRIDWLIAGDDGEETFLRRLKSDLDDIKSDDL